MHNTCWLDICYISKLKFKATTGLYWCLNPFTKKTKYINAGPLNDY